MLVFGLTRLRRRMLALHSASEMRTRSAAFGTTPRLFRRDERNLALANILVPSNAWRVTFQDPLRSAGGSDFARRSLLSGTR
jgi:hypothetical protein